MENKNKLAMQAVIQAIEELSAWIEQHKTNVQSIVCKRVEDRATEEKIELAVFSVKLYEHLALMELLTKLEYTSNQYCM